MPIYAHLQTVSLGFGLGHDLVNIYQLPLTNVENIGGHYTVSMNMCAVYNVILIFVSNFIINSSLLICG